MRYPSHANTQHRLRRRTMFTRGVCILALFGLASCDLLDGSEKKAGAATAQPKPLKLGAQGKASCKNLLLDDAEAEGTGIPAVDGRGGYWYTYADRSGSTVAPNDPYRHASNGAKGSKASAHVRGKLADDKIAYAGMGFHLAKSQMPYDLSSASGICFMARGNGPVRVTLSDVNTVPEGGVCKNCYNSFGKDFELTAEWKEYCFKFGQLAQSASWGDQMKAVAQDAVFGISWSAMKHGADYELWVDDIRLSCD